MTFLLLDILVRKWITKDNLSFQVMIRYNHHHVPRGTR